jgi:hypothetical protein
LQGSNSGIPVYVEIQTPTANSNGLVSLEIGSGSIVSGAFSDINWGNGPYFIKTETDITGGATYSISGVSELMSVPYALFSANSTPGPQGLAGINGVDGATGPTGPTGPIGPQGLAGINGVNGATGPMGPQGLVGNNGVNGTTGPMGPMGPVGPQGVQGPAGSSGSGIVPVFLTKDANYTIQNSDVTGELYITVTGENSTILLFTLPSAATVGAGKKINISNSSPNFPNRINVQSSGSDSLFGAYIPAGSTIVYPSVNYLPVSISFISDGISRWIIYTLN